MKMARTEKKTIEHFFFNLEDIINPGIKHIFYQILCHFIPN